MDLLKVRDAIVEVFLTPAALDAWVVAHVANVPAGAVRLASVIFAATNGAITPVASTQSGIPPVHPVRDWFVTKRPFANRHTLRDALDTFAGAQDGSDSVLVIEGEKYSGKSYGVRLARRVAPNGAFIDVDPAEWDAVPMTVADVAAILTGTTDQPPRVDLTKEDEAVPKLLATVKQRLKGSGTWIIVDNFNRANLTRAAATLLLKVADAIEAGSLPGVRLILADIDRSKLSRPLKQRSRRDRADLPDRNAVREWCDTLATHMGKDIDASLNQMVDDVFAGLTDPPPREVLVELLEERLSDAYARIARAPARR